VRVAIFGRFSWRDGNRANFSDCHVDWPRQSSIGLADNHRTPLALRRTTPAVRR
jgi:hypothetical protein